jgi:hypothetical protein
MRFLFMLAQVEEAWAARMPKYGHGSIEVRPIWD